MSRTLDIPEPVFTALESAAAATGMTPVAWIAAHLPTREKPDSNGARTLADLFAGRTGRIASGGNLDLSEECGDHFAQELQRKRSEGRL